MEENYEEYDDDCPCNTCEDKDFCDGWEASYCCARCHWLYDGDTPCDICDPMDI